MTENKNNMIDLTNLCLTDAVLGAVAAVKAGDDDVDVEHLTRPELASVAALLDQTNHWERLHQVDNSKTRRPVGPDTYAERQVTSGADYL